MPRLRRPKRYGEVVPGLWQGPLPETARDVDELRAAGVTRVLNLCDDGEYADPQDRAGVLAAYGAAGIEEQQVPSLDHGNLLPGLLELAVRTVRSWRQDGEVVLVHCLAGIERSAAVAAAVVADETGSAPREALRTVRRARRQARPLDHQVADLERWWAARAASGSGSGDA